MRQDREDKIDPESPALVVTYGNTPRKCRPLDRDVFLLGRSPVCDVSLMSPDVSPIHCVLVKGADGWRLRDCSTKGSTHLNGKGAPLPESSRRHSQIMDTCRPWGNNRCP